jgi:hypothetical protein
MLAVEVVEYLPHLVKLRGQVALVVEVEVEELQELLLAHQGRLTRVAEVVVDLVMVVLVAMVVLVLALSLTQALNEVLAVLLLP